MTDPTVTIAMASFGLTALSIALYAALRGWQGWLDLKRLELAGNGRAEPRTPTADRIEIADLKERIRKLENIAAAIDL
jgi:hypothetical protein